VIVHTLRRAREAECFDSILCLTDSPEIAAAARAAGFDALLAGCARNGTERIARSLDAIGAELVVDLQGDEPVFPPEGLRMLARALRGNPAWVHVPVHAGEVPARALLDANRVKAGLDARGFIVDFYRDRPRRPVAASRLQMGAYAYPAEFLRKYASLPPSEREISESHELLRDLDLYPLRAQDCALPSQAVDVPGDMEPALALLTAAAEAVRSRAADGASPSRRGQQMTIIDPSHRSEVPRVQA
jgi:3-deoxy-manno-octulosonate cytidylyltransferase (CMP-KDO synthetase)